ncbi:MARVEL domain-containing protein 1 isoform X3 [Alosa alosa]|uniref:MARVEL domain-containing protein 1 isoform X3 n=1 Tax=Alosa alosa TaxID=278164 RepID=UPI0020150FAD|nr:MARVEL domain-containing protein 1 isoform X3 [Alosa alosa]
MEESGVSRAVINTSSNPYLEFDHISTVSSIPCDKQFIKSAAGLLACAEVAHSRIPQVPWSTVVLIFNTSATLLYLVAAVVEATLVDHGVKGHHNYNSWAASTFFAFLVSLSYGGSAYLGFKAWRDRGEE